MDKDSDSGSQSKIQIWDMTCVGTHYNEVAEPHFLFAENLALCAVLLVLLWKEAIVYEVRLYLFLVRHLFEEDLALCAVLLVLLFLED